MTHTAIRHWAYNTETGELLGSSTSNGLKRRVKRTNRWYIKERFSLGSWVFFHGSANELHQRLRERL